MSDLFRGLCGGLEQRKHELRLRDMNGAALLRKSRTIAPSFPTSLGRSCQQRRPGNLLGTH